MEQRITFAESLADTIGRIGATEDNICRFYIPFDALSIDALCLFAPFSDVLIYPLHLLFGLRTLCMSNNTLSYTIHPKIESLNMYVKLVRIQKEEFLKQKKTARCLFFYEKRLFLRLRH